ncbi:MAG TPA: hypothetical protein VFS88_05695 [Micavibrio sp.]|nr:hypothetical protein [Micavibrio sp.]
MNREVFFWDSMSKLSSSLKSRRPITHGELNILYNFLEETHGLWEAGNFVKLCAHLKKQTVQEAAKAVIDLKSNNFMYEETIANEKKRVTGASRTRGTHGWGYSVYDSFNHSVRHTDYVARYPEAGIAEGTNEMREFLSEHFIHLTEGQKQTLSDLRPWGKNRQAPQSP